MESTLESVELRFSMGFEGLEQAQNMLDGATLLQRRDEESRTVLAWTSSVAHESQNLRFQSQRWIVVMKSPSDPQTASVVRTCCRISSNDDVVIATASQNFGRQQNISSRKLENTILRSIGQRVKNRVESVQQNLVGRAGSQGSGALIFV